MRRFPPKRGRVPFLARIVLTLFLLTPQNLVRDRVRGSAFLFDVDTLMATKLMLGQFLFDTSWGLLYQL